MKIYEFKFIYKNKEYKKKGIFENEKIFKNYLKKNRYNLISYKIKNRKIKISNKKLMFFTSFLISLLENDIDFIQSLEIINSEEDGIFSEIIRNILENIKNGKDIYSSFKKFDEIFPKNYIDLIGAGENSGNLIENLKKSYENLKMMGEFKEKIKKAIFYPTIVLGFISILLIFVFLFVLPNFKEFFITSEISLPKITKFLLFISDNFLIILVSIIIIISSIIIIFKSQTKEKREKIILKIPLLNKIVKKILIINLSQNLYIMLSSHIEIIEVLNNIYKNSDYIIIKKGIKRVRKNILRGENIHVAFEKLNIFTKDNIKLINIGEYSGTLPNSFERISILTSKKLDQDLFKIVNIIQPLLLSFLGIIIAIIMLGIYLPIFNLSEGVF